MKPLWRRNQRKLRSHCRPLAPESLEARMLLAGDAAVSLQISEFMAANGETLETSRRASLDESFPREKDTPDWIELTNLTDEVLDISGYHLSDDRDNLAKWSFPNGIVIPPGEQLVVFASRLPLNDPRLDEYGALHTNFKLDVQGEYLSVSSPQMVLHEYTDYGQQRADVSFGITSNGTVGYLKAATPGSENVRSVYDGLVQETVISVPRGYYSTIPAVAITTPEAGATIRYTTDGSRPTSVHGIVYSNPITITTTTVVKAAAFKDGYLPSNVNAQSYIFADHVLQQSQESGPQDIPSWGHRGPDYEMDPVIVQHPDAEIRPVAEDLLRIPTVSIALDQQLMFGSNLGGILAAGIYTSGQDVEQPITFEYFDPLAFDTTGVQTNSTVQIVGGTSPNRWNSDKLSMRVRFTETAGESQLDYPIFGTDAAVEFKTLVVDARYNYAWTYGGGGDSQRRAAQLMRDEFAADLQNTLGGYAPHARHVHVYINGIYWGVHTLHERPDENFQASYQAGVAEDYNIIKHSSGDVINGSNESYLELVSVLGRIVSADLTEAQYAAAMSLVDADNLIDYMLVNIYGGNNDWDHHNWYASQNPVDGKWRFHSWDAEKMLENVNASVAGLGTPGGPTGIHRRLMTHPEYALKFADQVQEYFFHDGPMTPAATRKLYQDRSEQIDLVMRVESARWGDNRITSGSQTRYTRQHWLDVRDRLFERYFPRRTEIVIGHLVRQGWFENGQAPEFSIDGAPQHGGFIKADSLLSMTAALGTIYFTTDGNDPRLDNGLIAPSATPHTDSTKMDKTTTVTARLLRPDGTWGPISRARFTTSVPASIDNLRISEVMYHPPAVTAAEAAMGFDDADEFEFLELVNISDQTIDVSRVRLQSTSEGNAIQGVSFDFANGAVVELGAGERVVVVENIDAFDVRYGNLANVAGQWSGRLSNRSERIVLTAGGDSLADFRYSDQWQPTTDGGGSSLQVINKMADPRLLNSANAWRPSRMPGGSPGRADLVIGDENGDGVFDSADLVAVFQAGKYEDGIPDNATFLEGDWNQDGDFDSADLVFAFQAGHYVATATPIVDR